MSKISLKVVLNKANGLNEIFVKTDACILFEHSFLLVSSINILFDRSQKIPHVFIY